MKILFVTLSDRNFTWQAKSVETNAGKGILLQVRSAFGTGSHDRRRLSNLRRPRRGSHPGEQQALRRFLGRKYH